jgi:hypothetical protein
MASFFSLAVERSDLAKDIKTIYECLCRNGEIRQATAGNPCARIRITDEDDKNGIALIRYVFRQFFESGSRSRFCR